MRRMLSLLLLSLAMLACTKSEGADAPAAVEPADPVTVGQSTNSAGSCVERYSPETLANRELVLDGVVTRIIPVDSSAEGPDLGFARVEITVNRWFKGGTGTETTLRSSLPTGSAITSAGGSVLPLEEGQRYLVSGDGGFMWSCGFTTPFSQQAATEWQAAME